jgi:hypothetical protein
MSVMSPNCVVCSAQFQVDEIDQAYYTKREVPNPKACPKCRLKRRLSFRNERKLHVRKSDLSGETIVSNIRPDAPFPVYHVDEWHKQNFETPQLEAYDFNRSFFEQYEELWRVAPRMHKASAGNEDNSEYSNHCGNCRNCYFIFNSEEDEDCMYLRFGDKCTDCVDSTNILTSELCLECVNVKNCYNVKFSDDCDNCSDSAFLRNCRGSKNCMFCYGLERQEYCLFNEKLDKEEYEKRIAEYDLGSYAGLEKCKQLWEEFSASWPKMRHIILNSENCSGDSIYNSRNTHDCFNVSDLQDCRYVLNSVDVKDSYDFYAYGMRTELCYECVTMAYCYDLKFCTCCMNSSYIEYCDNCWNCEYCFGCIGLKDGKYCIFNKQYSEEEYFEIVAKIKAQMTEAGEYGEFFPEKFSSFLYEDTLAQDYFPIELPSTEIGEHPGVISVAEMPDHIRETDLDLAEKTFWCEFERKPFKFQKNEIKFYKKMGVALPRTSFEARYKRRNELIPFPY